MWGPTITEGDFVGLRGSELQHGCRVLGLVWFRFATFLVVSSEDRLQCVPTPGKGSMKSNTTLNPKPLSEALKLVGLCISTALLSRSGHPAPLTLASPTVGV